jgi:hypothetical protein
MLSSEYIEKIQEYFSTQPVERVYLFGSFARSEENTNSDIDLLIELSNDSKIGLMKFSRMKIDIEKYIQHNVDLLTKSAISPLITSSIEKDLVKIYEKSN